MVAGLTSMPRPWTQIAGQVNSSVLPVCVTACVPSAAPAKLRVRPTVEHSSNLYSLSQRKMPSKPITFSIVDDDAGLRDSIVRFLTVKGGLVCVGQYGR